MGVPYPWWGDRRKNWNNFLDVWEANKEKPHFKPEVYYRDFHTLWSITSCFRKRIKCTYRESVTMLALASGLRYTGSCSISYPKTLIYEIITFKRGYKRYIEDKGFEPTNKGWEMRSLKEFQKLSRTHLKRLIFLMACKLALQMNLQITLFLIKRIQHKNTNLQKAVLEGR